MEKETKKVYSFGAMMSRMKYIKRWPLMRNATRENISEHSLVVAMVAHLLGVIGKTRFGKDLNVEKIALIAIYHNSKSPYGGGRGSLLYHC